MLNLRLKVNLLEETEAMIGLLSSFISRKLSIKNSNWISNKRKDEIIQLDILNRHLQLIQENPRTCIYFFNKSKKLW